MFSSKMNRKAIQANDLKWTRPSRDSEMIL